MKYIAISDDVYDAITKYKDTPTVEEYVDKIIKVNLQKISSRYARGKIVDGYALTNQPLELVKNIMEDYNNGMSTIAIAEKHGMWQKTVWRIIDRNKHKITRWK